MGRVTDMAAVIAPVLERTYGGSQSGLAAECARALVAAGYGQRSERGDEARDA